MKLCLFIMVFSVGAIAAPTNNTLDEFFKDKTRIENPLELRDPFKSPQPKGQQRRQGGAKHKKADGSYSNLAGENLRDWNIYELKVVGVMIGKERRAMITRNVAEGTTANKVVVVKEGSSIGPDNAEVKAILPGGIILVEKIINVYGQEEYLETVVPISR
jgi:type IV pilus assembly protein PilP